VLLKGSYGLFKKLMMQKKGIRMGIENGNNSLYKIG
jgi:hypothetical protein